MILGNFIEARAPDEVSAPMAHAILKKLGLQEPYITSSYFDLWQQTVAAGLKKNSLS
jgi:hypothetical protein